MSGTWLSGWVAGDIVTAAEFGKGIGSVYSSTLGAPAANIDITSLPTYGSGLLIVGAFLSDQAANQSINIAFNNDTTATNYSRGGVSHSGATPNSTSANDRLSGMNAHGTNNVAYAAGMMWIPGFRGSSKKAWISMMAHRDAATTTAVQMWGGHWIQAGGTAAITRITLAPASGNFNTGSTINLYVLGA